MNIGSLKIYGQFFRLMTGKPGQRLANSLQNTGKKIGSSIREARARTDSYRSNLSRNLGITGERIGFSLTVFNAAMIPVEIVAENMAAAGEFLEKGPNID
jgi:hypothetical protein